MVKKKHNKSLVKQIKKSGVEIDIPVRTGPGRPPKYSTPEELKKLGEDYFIQRTSEKRPVTVTGLAIALGLDRRGLIGYENKSEFNAVVKELKSKVEDFNEMLLFTNHSTGAIFNLKVNFGWRDPQDIEANKGINETLNKIAELLK